MGPNKIQGSKNTWLIGQNGITSTRITSTSDVTQGIEMPVVGDVMSSPSPIGNNDNDVNDVNHVNDKIQGFTTGGNINDSDDNDDDDIEQDEDVLYLNHDQDIEKTMMNLKWREQ